MRSLTFEKLAQEVTGQKVQIFEPRDPNDKWSSYDKFNGELKPSKKYGIIIGSDGGGITYDFKTTTKIETFFKSFINQHIRKYEMKQMSFELVDGKVISIYPTRDEVIKKYTTDRVTKYHYYTTLYGIGMFAFFTKDIAKATANLAKYLTDKGIQFYNEYSDAGWAYRFVISKKVEDHNILLEKFEL
tara:strand:+ start:19449 stop:20009 length:561 start_codon:yes stop_codon:yes gene_type:complete